MFYFFLLLEIILLGLVSSGLQKNILYFLQRVLKSRNAVMIVYASLFFPGVLLHELSHFLVAAILLIPIGQINLLPSIEEDQIHLGRVTIGKVDPIRRAASGLAPLFIGLASLAGIVLFLSTNFSILPWWKIVLFVYLLFIISNSMFPSRQDWSGTLEFFIAIAVVFLLILGVLFFIGFRFSYSLPTFLTDTETVEIIKKIDLLLLVP